MEKLKQKEHWYVAVDISNEKIESTEIWIDEYIEYIVKTLSNVEALREINLNYPEGDNWNYFGREWRKSAYLNIYLSGKMQGKQRVKNLSKRMAERRFRKLNTHRTYRRQEKQGEH